MMHPYHHPEMSYAPTVDLTQLVQSNAIAHSIH